ncbi:MAG: hypothetical protein GY898_06140 [Proteobacteria bacterium]|nr:hypothetical protein [Pseudomonadota bacterium]
MDPIAIRKANPTPGDVHQDRPLTNISVNWIQEQTRYIAHKIFPMVPVAKQSDLYYKFDRADWLRAVAEKRAPSTESAGGGFRITTDSYYADVWAFHKDVDDQLRANADQPLNPDRNATQFATQACVTRREVEWATNYFTTSIWTGSSTGGDITVAPKWDAADSTPIEDVRLEIYAILSKTGFKPNKLVLGADVWKVLQDHPDFLDRINRGQTPVGPAIVNKAALAAILEIDEVVVAEAVYNTGPEGGTESTGFIVGNHDVLLVYAAPAPALEVPSAGYNFVWTGLFGAGAAGNRISNFRMQHLKSDRIECEMSWAQKVVAAELGAFLDNVLT